MATACPICGASFSLTDIDNHVNLCLDSGASAFQEVPEPRASNAKRSASQISGLGAEGGEVRRSLLTPLMSCHSDLENIHRVILSSPDDSKRKRKPQLRHDSPASFAPKLSPLMTYTFLMNVNTSNVPTKRPHRTKLTSLAQVLQLLHSAICRKSDYDLCFGLLPCGTVQKGAVCSRHEGS